MFGLLLNNFCGMDVVGIPNTGSASQAQRSKTMAKHAYTVEGDDIDEVKSGLNELLESLGGKKKGKKDDDDENDLVGDDDEGSGSDDDDSPDYDAIRDKLKKAITKLSAEDDGPDKILAAFKKAGGGKKLQDIEDESLVKVAKSLKVKV
jgi:hypothetical protein